MVMPIINVPEVGIVTMEAITKRPVVVETPDGDVIAIRSIMNMVLARRPPSQRRGGRGRAACATIKAWLEGGRAGDADLLNPAMPRRVALTGGAGFIGGAVARTLAARGDDVVALVRDPDRPGRLREIGARLVADDLSDIGRLTRALDGADAVIHSAGSYRVGVPASERDAMWDANVGTTTRVLDSAAAAAGVSRIVYVSTVNVFGNTHGKVVDESYRRDLGGRLPQLVRRDEVPRARDRGDADRGRRADRRRRCPARSTGRTTIRRSVSSWPWPTPASCDTGHSTTSGVGLVHVDDLAAGIVAALDHGTVGRSYVLSGPRTTLRDAIGLAARLGGRKPPAFRLPTGLLRVMAPIGRFIGQPNLREVIASSSGVTYWATADRARAELGWQAREIEAGFRDMFATA